MDEPMDRVSDTTGVRHRFQRTVAPFLVAVLVIVMLVGVDLALRVAIDELWGLSRLGRRWLQVGYWTFVGLGLVLSARGRLRDHRALQASMAATDHLRFNIERTKR
jgi:hypothetical protein